MNNRGIWTAVLALWCTATMAQRTLSVSVENPTKTELTTATPVIVNLRNYDSAVQSAVVKLDGQEVASQLDDLDGDGSYDELCFLTTLGRKERRVFCVELSNSGQPRTYEPLVYAEMLLTNKKIKSENRQDLYISSLTVDNGTNPYWQLHHHGPAFENELVAYRIYFDHRQTVDIYGKQHRGLELRQTQFYPDSTQKATGYGDDVLWVGQTFGLGTLRGWDGEKPQMLTDVAHRTLRIVSRGPLRTIVEVIDEGWRAPGTELPVTMTTRYTLYSGRRDCLVDVSFDRPVPDLLLATGIINVKNSEEYSDRAGLRGCWGTDWPVSAKDSVGHKRETVGLGICLPSKHVVSELPANKDNYPYVIGNIADRQLHYAITFGSDNEDFGYHAAPQWFAYLQDWKRQLGIPVKVTVK